MESILPFLTGPNGGIMAVVGAVCFAGGYSFANRTVLKSAIDRMEEMKLEYDKEISELKEEVRRRQELYFEATGKDK